MSVATTDCRSCIESRLTTISSPFELLAFSASERPQHPALEYLSDNLTMPSLSVTYAQLLHEVKAMACALRASGLKPDESVAILLPFVPEAVIAMIAASAVGIAFPINLLLSAEALRSQLLLARCRIVVTLGPHPALDIRERLNLALEGMEEPPSVVEVPVAGVSQGGLAWSDFISFEPSFHLEDSADRVAMLIHTGGTTGHPKLARLSLRNMTVAALMAAEGLRIGPSERLLSGLPLFHVGGAIDALLAALAVGATVIFPTAQGMRNPAVVERIWSLVEQHKITLMGTVPTIIAAIVESHTHSADLSCLRALMTGGAPLSSDLAQRFQAKIGKPICQLYGMTESSGIATARRTDSSSDVQTAGVPVPLVQVSLGEAGAQYGPGASGEVFVRGPNVFQGYLTAEGVVGNPEGGWFASGDLGEVTANGELRIVGRAKDVIIRSGHNIDPQMIEEAALGHPAILQAAAVAMPDDYAGEVPVLFVTLRAGTAVTADDLSSYVAREIAEPPARPRHVFFLDELPLTPFAKVARFRLRQRAVEFRVQQALATVLSGFTAVCSDPLAKRVVVTSSTPLSAQCSEQVEHILGRLGLVLA
ncbi:TPA: AMP-binding protein [Pseudomonas aeruginosa]|uniref:AMP-binding protein n=1 Tax=Pseudomonas aeruginosa TaxID=287 RepID=UPI000543C6DE|nr:AMP-binding protein [Pseudomonas aeruginosa]KHE57319.1 long-chain fatty acid--CoA ligase [Pseudomonas aeruginosa]KSP86061.1 acyl-CoA synthetase [Pseudomonas aeruginosa]MBX6718744.1 AMP-binding protein [Pseudomonas aeruginosa]MBX6874740.1 AMP-binding protein [Pseudomonas aeruginosa]WHV52057.1 AMP-binding protein [Pseudomonas aeruginosa]